MEQMIKVIIVLALLIVASMIQVMLSKMRSAMLGLLLPMIVLVTTTVLLVLQLKVSQENLSLLKNLSYYAILNVPTIVFCCIYNYYKRKGVRTENR